MKRALFIAGWAVLAAGTARADLVTPLDPVTAATNLTRWHMPNRGMGILDAAGQPILKEQNFTNYGIAVIEARITEMRPNEKFVDHMQLKQKASADRAIAR